MRKQLKLCVVFTDKKRSFLAAMAQSQIQIKCSQQRECMSCCVCFPVGQACGHERLSVMYEKIVLYHGKSQLTGSF